VDARRADRARVIYISQGNIPSKWAHTFQAMKMADALAAHVQALTLLTAGSFLPAPSGEIGLRSWYGVSDAFAVRRIPVRLRAQQIYLRQHRDRRFDCMAAGYARLRSPDLVYTRSPGAARACVQLGLPTILETHAPGRYDVSRLLDLAARRALRGVVTVSPGLRDDYAELGIPQSKLMLAPDAVDIERFGDVPSLELARRALGIEVDASIAAYCGHFYPEKGVECLIDAARRLPGVLFYLIGGWPEDIEEMKKRAEGCANVRFPGFVANGQLPHWLAAADVLVLPTSGRFDHAQVTSPLKLFEYMAARRPVVASAIPALEGFLLHERNALVVAPDSPRALADALAKLTAQPELGARLAERAWREVQQYTWARRAAAILEHFGFPVEARPEGPPGGFAADGDA
jgi:glycosyltransferase involved in cell wall biosynthesis